MIIVPIVYKGLSIHRLSCIHSIYMPRPYDYPVTNTPLELRERVKGQYLAGKGSVAVVARANGIKPATAQAWAVRERWATLRHERTRARVNTINDQLCQIEGLLANEKDGKQKQALATAYEKLYSVMAWLTGIPRPGVRWEPKPKSRRARGDED